MNPVKQILGLDIGGTKCAAILGDADGKILHRTQWPSNSHRGPAAMIDDICARAAELIHSASNLSAVGVSIGGPLDANAGIILSPPNLPGWDRIPLKAILQDRLQLPVQIEHDAAACGLAEYRWGAGRGASRLIYLTCGTGFGAGFVIDGKIYRGAAGQSLEIGHARFREDGPVAFNKRGSIEAWCAGASLGKLAAWKFPHRWPQPPSAEDLADLWKAGDPDAAQVIQLNARAVGEVCANLCDFLRPQLILLGSLALHLGQPWVDWVREKCREEALVDSPTRIDPAGLGAQLQDCSALAVAAEAQ